jgi:hypothetical protein
VKVRRYGGGLRARRCRGIEGRRQVGGGFWDAGQEVDAGQELDNE